MSSQNLVSAQNVSNLWNFLRVYLGTWHFGEDDTEDKRLYEGPDGALDHEKEHRVPAILHDYSGPVPYRCLSLDREQDRRREIVDIPHTDRLLQ